MEPTDLAHDLLEWTDPVRVGSRVTSMCHDVPGEFWELWKEHKDELKAAGIRAFRDDDDGHFFMTWVRGADEDQIVQQPAAQMAIPKVTRFLKSPKDFAVQCPGLHPDQRDAVWTLLQAIKRGCRFTLDASDAGIGKTWIALTLMRLLGWNFGVICPANVVTKWTDTALEFPFELEPEFVLSYERLKSGNHHFVQREDYTYRGKDHTRFSWQTVDQVALVFDEVHYCSGTDSLNAQLLKGAIENPHTLIHTLSATVADSPLDMRAVGFGLELHDWKGWWQWCKRSGARPGHFGGLQFNTGINDSPTINQRIARVRLAQIHAHVFPGRGTRIKVGDTELWRPKNLVMAELIDVQKDHPDIQGLIQVIRDKEDQDLARAEASDDSGVNLVTNVRARQRAETYRLPYFRRRILDLTKEGNSVVVFLNYSASIDWLLESIDGCSTIRGGMTERGRAQAMTDFQTNKHRVCICQIEAGGQSIDLDDTWGDAPRCTLISPTYKAKLFYQVIGRAYRPATTKSMVRQWVIFAAETIEEKVGRIVQAKLHAQSLINDGDLSPVILTK